MRHCVPAGFSALIPLEEFLNRSETEALGHEGRQQVREKRPEPGRLLRQLRRIWDLLPPKDDQQLLKYIVYRLEDDDTISGAGKTFLLFTVGALLLVVVVSVAVLMAKKFIFPGDIYWISESTHTIFEIFSSFISILVGVILSWEYLASGKRNILFLACAFFSIGIFDSFHALSNQFHSLFIWYHSAGILLGSLFFFGSVFVHRAKDPDEQFVWIRRLSVFCGILGILVFAVLPRAFYLYIPDVLSVSIPHHTHVSLARGPFSTFIYSMNYVSCAIYLFVGIFFVKGFQRSRDIIYVIFAMSVLLFFISEVFFAFSALWDPLWWYWHFIKVINFAGLLLGLAYGFTKTFYRLNTSKMQLASLLGKIEGKNIELEKAYVALKETQGYLSESEKLASIGKMAAMMAHEIRNPLCSITNSVGVLKNYTLRPEESSELFGVVEGEMERLNKLTEDFLSFAKPSHLRRSRTNLNALIDKTLCLLSAGKTMDCRVEFRKALAPDLPFLTLDRNHIKQVFINILMNSLQAMPEGGVITILTRYKRPEEEVEITFSDTGSGMSAEVMSQVFQPFYTTKDKGLGLGLNIIHKIVKEHGGYILLSSKEGGGTQITLCFPVMAETGPRDLQEADKLTDVILEND